MDLPREGRTRVAIIRVEPTVDDGRFAAKAERGRAVVVAAQMTADGHDQLAGQLEWMGPGQTRPALVWLTPRADDWWDAAFVPTVCGAHRFRVRGWIERFLSWRSAFHAQCVAGTATAVDAAIGQRLLADAWERADADARPRLRAYQVRLAAEDPAEALAAALDPELARLMRYWGPRPFPAVSPWRPVLVERVRAGFSSWYECFPRSTSTDPARPGTFRDLTARLPYVAQMGFDVLYLPPIHPIGHTGRKGPDNTLGAGPGDPGSPWAVGAPEGGHCAIHPQLGTVDDFRALLAEARHHGLEVALDLAFQCSPDHPDVIQHPEWFRRRPDGSVQYAENPPKRYQDIFPYDFETDAWPELWRALADVVRYWITLGVQIFRVDNPHTKPLPFWEWLLAEIRADHPDVLFLAEAFTRPALMYQLAKVGFSQSYTYFTWRNTAEELRAYVDELTHPPVSYFFRPNFWPNTPDILPVPLQQGGRAAFLARVVLAGTLSSNYGIYGPAFELMERDPAAPGSEEYAHSEKYEVRHWDWDRPDSLAPVIARLNRARREHPALQSQAGLAFHPADNDQILVYSKASPDGQDTMLMAVNLDPHHVQSGFVHLDTGRLGLEADQPYMVEDLLTGERYFWTGSHNYVELHPERLPAHVLHVQPPAHGERHFDQFR